MSKPSMSAVSLSWNGVTARRMNRHSLAEPAKDLDPAGIAGVMCGAHAQVLSAAELSIGRRILGATRADVRRAVWDDRTLCKTFGPRGTVHLLLPQTCRCGRAPFRLPSSVPMHPEPVRFTAEQSEEVIAAIGDALADAGLTVDELTDAIVERAGPWAGERTMDAFQDKWPRWRQLTSTAAHRGVLCFEPTAGQGHVYRSAPLAPGPAARRRRHRPPGTRPTLPVRLRSGDAPAFRQVAQHPAVASRFVVRRDGRRTGTGRPGRRTRWVVAGDRRRRNARTEIRLLSYFDAFVVAGQPRERLFPGAAAARALSPTGQAGNYRGDARRRQGRRHWHQRRSGRKVAITVERLEGAPPDATPAARRRGRVDRSGDGGGPALTIGTVTVGPHALSEDRARRRRFPGLRDRDGPRHLGVVLAVPADPSVRLSVTD